jgi:methylmalonyl-CoA/ethylmalonyl-CoA epimerase
VTNLAANNRPVQFSYVVRDLEEAMTRFRDAMRLGPFFLIENLRLDEVRYRGDPSELEISLALAHTGDVEIELIMPVTTAPSALSDHDTGAQCRFHHVCYLTDSYFTDIEVYRNEGFAIATQGRAMGSIDFCYIDTFAQLGHMTELAAPCPEVVQLHETVRLAAIDWNGRDAIRRL